MPAKRTITASRFVNADTFRGAAIARAVPGSRYSGDHYRDADLFRSSQVARSEGVVDMDQFFPSTVAVPTYSDPPTLFGADLIFFYDADVGVYKDAGTTLAANTETVQQWNDQSGNGKHLSMATSGERPQYLTAGFNGGKAVKFTAATPTRMLTDATVGFPATANLAVFIVGQMLTGTNSSGRALSYVYYDFSDAGDANMAALLLRNLANDEFYCRRGGVSLGIQAISLATNYRLGIVFDGSNCTSYVNNANPTATASTEVFGGAGVLGVGSGLATRTTFQATTAWDGPISKIVGLKIVPDATQRTNLDNWFKQQCGL